MDYPLLDDLTVFVTDTRYEDLPQVVIDESKRVILDSIGCAFAGTTHKRGQIGTQYGTMQGGNDATILATGQRASIFGAAFANAEAINALDFDAILPPGHVAPYVIPPALAMAEYLKSDGRTLILAVALAHEISYRIGKAMDYTRDTKDGKVNPPTVWGFASTIFGATAATAKIKAMSPDDVNNALSLAALISPVNSAANWREHSPPTTIKYALGGWIAHGALTAAHMAEMGHRGDSQIFDPEFGYPRFIGTRRWEPAFIVQDLGNVWHFPREEAFKHYPHCRVLAAPFDALVDIVRKNDIKVEEIEGIKAWVEGFLERPLWMNRNITDVTDAQFSVAHGIALGAHDFKPGPDWQSKENVYSPSVMNLMDKVEHVVHPDYVASLTGDAAARPTRVEVRARGQVFAEERTHPMGTSRSDSPFYFPTEQLVEKFLHNAAYVLPENLAREMVEKIDGLADLADVNELTALIRPAQK